VPNPTIAAGSSINKKFPDTLPLNNTSTNSRRLPTMANSSPNSTDDFLSILFDIATHTGWDIILVKI
jgi:hypothetical protein